MARLTKTVGIFTLALAPLMFAHRARAQGSAATTPPAASPAPTGAAVPASPPPASPQAPFAAAPVAPPPPPPAAAPEVATVAPPPPPPAAPPADKVQFVPDDPSLTLLQRAGVRPVARFVGGPYSWWYERRLAPTYSPLCTGPCATALAPGEYQLALSKSGRVLPSAPVVIDGPSALHAEFVDRSALRLVGWVIDAAGLVVATVMIIASYHSDDSCDDDDNCTSGGSFDGPLLATGVVVLVGSVLLGSLFLTAHDEARITVVPLSQPAIGAGREGQVAGLSALPPLEGAALRIQF
ncbi:MAG: hypothetical protein WBY94_04365 [Polyangiaceae bacterium]